MGRLKEIEKEYIDEMTGDFDPSEIRTILSLEKSGIFTEDIAEIALLSSKANYGENYARDAYNIALLDILEEENEKLKDEVSDIKSKMLSLRKDHVELNKTIRRQVRNIFILLAILIIRSIFW